MSIPKVEVRGNIFHLTWVAEQLTCIVSRLATRSDRVTCELLFKTTDPLYHEHILHTSFNLVAGRSRPVLADQLSSAYDKLDKPQANNIIEQLCFKVLELYREGEPILELMANEEIHPSQYKVYPLIAENEVNVIYGEGGAGKSLLAMALSIIIQLPWGENPLGLKNPRIGRILWLDWETSENTARRNLKLLTKGFGLPPNFFIAYRRCSQPLPSDLETIQNLCLEHSIDTVIIDSAGLACGGDMNKTEFVNAFFAALRSLNVTSIIISHLSKEAMQRNVKKRTPMGSIYFFNQPRNIWECRAVQEPNSPVLTIGLFHTKCNIDKKAPSMAFTFTFADDEIIVATDDPKAIPEFSGQMSLSIQILECLKTEKQSLTRQEITAMLDAKEDSIKRTLTRLHQQNKIVHLSNQKWGLSYHG